MQRKKWLIATAILAVLTTGGIIIAADHLDSPAVRNQNNRYYGCLCIQGTGPQ
jgi:hypothetical protein